MAKITLKDGTVLEGNPTEVLALVEALGEGKAIPGYYRSETKGLCQISEMHEDHIKNAVLKEYRAWVAELSSKSAKTVIEAIGRGLDNPEFLELCTELQFRNLEGELVRDD